MQMTTLVTEGARQESHEKRALFFLLGLPPLFLAFLARVHSPHYI